MPVRCPAPCAMPFCAMSPTRPRVLNIHVIYIHVATGHTLRSRAPRSRASMHVHGHGALVTRPRASETAGHSNGHSNSRRSTCRHLCSLIACALGADPKSETRGETRERQRQLAESTAVSPNATTRRPLTRCDDMMGRSGCSVYVDLAAARQSCSRAEGLQTLAPHLSYMSRI